MLISHQADSMSLIFAFILGMLTLVMIMLGSIIWAIIFGIATIGVALAGIFGGGSSDVGLPLIFK